MIVDELEPVLDAPAPVVEQPSIIIIEAPPAPEPELTTEQIEAAEWATFQTRSANVESKLEKALEFLTELKAMFQAFQLSILAQSQTPPTPMALEPEVIPEVILVPEPVAEESPVEKPKRKRRFL